MHKREAEAERLRGALQELDEAALLRYGIVAKYMFGRIAQCSVEQRSSILMRLEEAGLEWKRRHSDLPLSDSLD